MDRCKHQYRPSPRGGYMCELCEKDIDSETYAEIAQLTAERDRYRDALLGGIQHRYLGDCPDPSDNTRRDKDCPACQILLQEAK